MLGAAGLAAGGKQQLQGPHDLGQTEVGRNVRVVRAREDRPGASATEVGCFCDHGRPTLGRAERNVCERAHTHAGDGITPATST